MLERIRKEIERYEVLEAICNDNMDHDDPDLQEGFNRIQVLADAFNSSVMSLPLPKDVMVLLPVVKYDNVFDHEWKIENPEFPYREIHGWNNEKLNGFLKVLWDLNVKYDIGFGYGSIQFQGTPETGVTGVVAQQEMCNSNAKYISIDFESGEFYCHADSVREDLEIKVKGNLND